MCISFDFSGAYANNMERVRDEIARRHIGPMRGKQNRYYHYAKLRKQLNTHTLSLFPRAPYFTLSLPFISPSLTLWLAWRTATGTASSLANRLMSSRDPKTTMVKLSIHHTQWWWGSVEVKVFGHNWTSTKFSSVMRATHNLRGVRLNSRDQDKLETTKNLPTSSPKEN